VKKSLVVLVIAAVLGMLAYNYVTSGRLSLLPVQATEADRQLADLERQLEGARQRQAQAQRMAGVAGIDASRDFAQASEEVQRLERAIAALKQKGSQ
jgi:hypothetical protein